MKVIRPLLLSLLLTFSVFAQSSFAIPILQLYVDGSTYDTATESWMTYDDPFTLQVLGARQQRSLKLVDQVMLHIAVPAEYYRPSGTVTISAIQSSLEHGVFAPLTFTADSFVHGIPAQLSGTSGSARSHGIYQDAYYLSVQLDSLDVRKTPADKVINYVDIAKGLTPGTGIGDIDRYLISYSDFFLIHMDLTGVAHYDNKKKDGPIFAPFSHDADAPTPPPAVPEPATLALILVGLLMAAGMARCRA